MGVLRNMAQRLEKVPRCPEMMKWANMVKRTLMVQIRQKGSLRLRLGGLLIRGVEEGDVGDISTIGDVGVAGSSAPIAS